MRPVDVLAAQREPLLHRRFAPRPPTAWRPPSDPDPPLPLLSPPALTPTPAHPATAHPAQANEAPPSAPQLTAPAPPPPPLLKITTTKHRAPSTPHMQARAHAREAPVSDDTKPASRLTRRP